MVRDEVAQHIKGSAPLNRLIFDGREYPACRAVDMDLIISAPGCVVEDGMGWGDLFRYSKPHKYWNKNMWWIRL